MRYPLRQKRLRDQRMAFFFFVALAFMYLVAGLPVIAGKLASNARQAARHVLPAFVELDRNRDGYVDSSELSGYPAYASTFSRADATGDGRLSPAEFAAALRRLERAP